MTITTISDLQQGDEFSDDMQTRSHSRIFLSKTEPRFVHNPNLVYVKYNDNGYVHTAEYSPGWPVRVYNR